MPTVTYGDCPPSIENKGVPEAQHISYEFNGYKYVVFADGELTVFDATARSVPLTIEGFTTFQNAVLDSGDGEMKLLFGEYISKFESREA